MSLANRLGQRRGPNQQSVEVQQAPRPITAQPAAAAEVPVSMSVSREVASIAARLHSRIIDKLDLATVSQIPPHELRQRLRQIIDQLVAAEKLSLSEGEREAVTTSVLDEILGLGPLEPIIKDPAVSDILVNGADTIFVEKRGKLTKVEARFRNDQHLIHTIQRICARVGRRIDESSPMVDARLTDGSRVNAVIPPLALDGPALSIRRFSSRPLGAQDLLKNGAASAPMLDYLAAAVAQRCSILITGGTGAGKTTLLNVLSSFIPGDERIITVEDSAELKLVQPHVVRLETRPPNLEGKGEVTIRDLVRNALRMRPDRIVVGECRGAEVLDMLQAMNTGHEGSLSTIHANSTRDALGRLTTMLGMAGTALAEETMKTMIARAIHVIVHVARFKDGQRRITGISEITGQMGATINLHDVFVYEKKSVSANGSVVGTHKYLARSTMVGVAHTEEA